MNELSMLVTITDRNTTKRFISLYESFGVNVTFSTVGSGTPRASCWRPLAWSGRKRP